MRAVISRLAGVAAVAALSATILTPSRVAAVAGFGDVDAGRFYSEPIQWMVDE